MREILFRGKKSKDGQWAKGLLVKDVKGHMRIQFNPTAFSVVVIPETVGQFTGLTDKNGVKIFEGDIVKFSTGRHKDKIAAVKWDDAGMWLPFRDDEYVQDEQGDWFERDENDEIFEVVGNIHSNPELLNP